MVHAVEGAVDVAGGVAIVLLGGVVDDHVVEDLLEAGGDVLGARVDDGDDVDELMAVARGVADVFLEGLDVDDAAVGVFAIPEAVGAADGLEGAHAVNVLQEDAGGDRLGGVGDDDVTAPGVGEDPHGVFHGGLAHHEGLEARFLPEEWER